MNQKATAMLTALSLNRDVYKALSALDLSKTDATTRYYVTRTLLEFRLAGVDKDDATRAKLKQLNDDLTGQVTRTNAILPTTSARSRLTARLNSMACRRIT